MLKNRIGLIYGILIVLLLLLGGWWVFYLTKANQALTQAELQKLTNDRIHAAFLIQADARVRADPERWLSKSFPELEFVRQPGGNLTVRIDPLVRESIMAKDRRMRRMFLSEGLFFFLLLTAGSLILIRARRSELRYKQTRELFLAGATHEFKTPLASLRLYTETLARHDLDPDKQAAIQSRMVDDVGRLEEMVDEILSTSAADMFASGHRSALDLLAECRTVVQDLQSFAAENEAVFRIEGGPGAVVMGHRAPLSLALRNLLVNAVQHSEEPVTVTVIVRPGVRRHRVLVIDDGPGIPPRLHDKVFECFYTTGHGGRAGGTGLGLHLVRRNLELLDGTVDLDSEPGRGCAFTLTLPAWREG